MRISQVTATSSPYIITSAHTATTTTTHHPSCQELDGSWLLGVSKTMVLEKQGFSDAMVRSSDESAELKLDRG